MIVTIVVWADSKSPAGSSRIRAVAIINSVPQSSIIAFSCTSFRSLGMVPLGQLAVARSDDGCRGAVDIQKQDSLLLLLDGLDEVSAARREEVSRLIEAAAKDFSCGIVISTRPEVAQGKQLAGKDSKSRSGRMFASAEGQVRILPMNNAALETFILLWTGFAAASETERKAQAERLRTALTRPGIRALARNPLMMTAMAALTTDGRQLPEQRAALFEEIVTWMVNARARDPGVNAGDLRRKLSDLALKMIEEASGNKYQVSLGRAAQLIEAGFSATPEDQRREAAEQYLKDAEERTGLLTRRGTELAFWHRYLQEFLAARRLSGWSYKRAELSPKLLRSRECPEVLKLLAGCMVDSPEELSEMLAGLMESAAGWPVEDQAYAAGVLGAALEDLRPSGYYPDGPDYRAAVRSKWENLRDAVLPILEDAAQGARISLATRVAVAEALGQAGDPRLRLPRADLGDAKWQEYWVKVEGGEFWMGAQKHTKGRPDYDPEANDGEERKTNPISVGNFWMGRHPVTAYEYELYVQREGLEPVKEMGLEEQMKHASRPLVKVTWEEAKAYCEWARGALPSEEQWEYAARGRKGWKYMWGNEPSADEDENLANCRMRVGEPTPVGLFPAGAQRETGIMDLCGNVFEWTSSPYRKGGATKVLRGGSFLDDAWYLRAAFRYVNVPDERNSNIGFRCVREVSP